ncbi:hypothetical protein [Lacticaseibacillus parakribbianus]|uniref:hypothetical protein n=1 Tax=Lacticaseibacillus parakribbianus TaxID=2970927 RepID=UPI0021CAFA4B|nr:hypothetical protein [Lacticaseibacillus parakribbianus]
MTGKMIYIPVHTSGEYSDYTEYVIGVFDSKEAALEAAAQGAAKWNAKSHYADGDVIKLRHYPLNQAIRGTSEAERVAYAMSDDWGKVIYELDDGDDYHAKLVKVEEDER